MERSCKPPTVGWDTDMPAIAATMFRRRKRTAAPITPVFIGAVHVAGGAAVNYPGAFAPGDFGFLVTIAASGGVPASPAGWTPDTSLFWFGAYELSVHLRIIGAENSFAAMPGNAGCLLIYRGANQEGATNGNSGVETTDAANQIIVPSINTTHALNRTLCVVCDRDPSLSTLLTAGWTTRVQGNSAFYSMSVADKATGAIGATGTVTWNQATTNPFRSAGFQAELRP